MIEVSTIEDALGGGDLRTIEAAFEALVEFGHDKTIAGARNVDMLCSLLARVTRALQHDQAAMPGGLVKAIAAALDVPLGPVADYAAGARLVADHAYHWRGVYLQYALSTGGV